MKPEKNHTRSRNPRRVSIADALDSVARIKEGIPSAFCFDHGTLQVKMYRPTGRDPQQPHTRDEIYVIARNVAGVAPAVHHYHSQTHSLALLREGIAPPAFESYLFMGQRYAVDAAATLVLAFMPSRSLKKYADRGYRYALIEAGHVGQNVALAAAALGLGCCSIGGFLDVELGQFLTLDPERAFPVYALAVGPKA